MWPAHTPSTLWCGEWSLPFKIKIMKNATYSWMDLASLKTKLGMAKIPFQTKDAWLSHFDAEKRRRIVLAEDMWDVLITKDFLVRESVKSTDKGQYTEFLICLPKAAENVKIA